MIDLVSFEIGYKTGSGNTMPIIVYGGLMHRMEIPVDPDSEQGQFCCTEKMECKGFNGGCPPYAPHFSKLKKDIDNAYLIVLEFDMANSIRYSGWWKGVSAPGLYILVYADRLTMNYMQRALRVFENLGYYTLGVSNCPGCRPKDCMVTRGRPCEKPKKRRFSVEATGMRCDILHDALFDEVLPWWFHTPKHIPESMFRYALVFADKPYGVMDDILEDFVFNDKSYCRYTPAIVNSDSYDLEILGVPIDREGGGRNYCAYRLPEIE